MSDPAYPKNRPNWRLQIAGYRGNPNAKFPGYRSSFGDQHHRQCAATAKSTGQRCRCAAISASTRCGKHGGHLQGMRAEQQRLGIGRVISAIAGRSARRRALVKLAISEPWPEGVRPVPSLVKAGWVIEAWQNRELAPDQWKAALEYTNYAGYKPRAPARRG